MLKCFLASRPFIESLMTSRRPMTAWPMATHLNFLPLVHFFGQISSSLLVREHKRQDVKLLNHSILLVIYKLTT